MAYMCILLLGAFGHLFIPSAHASYSDVMRLNASVMDATSAWDYRRDGDGNLWLGYYDVTRTLWIRAPDGKETAMVPEGRNQSPSGLALAPLQRGAAVLWRDKHPTKGLFITTTEQLVAEPLEVAGVTEPLTRFLARRSGERVHVLWYGEQELDGAKSKYNVFYRELDLANNVLTPIERVLPGIYPAMAVRSSGDVLVASRQAEVDGLAIVARFRSHQASEFGPPVSIANVPATTPIFDVFRSGQRWFVVWHTQYEGRSRNYLLEGAYSDDDGATWTRFNFESLRGYDIGSLDVAATDQGHIALAVTARDTGARKSKQDVWLIRSENRGTTFSEPQRLRTARHLHTYHARNPSVTFGEEAGDLLVVWEDWRNIRSRLYASLSDDYGKTWAVNNALLPGQGEGKNFGLRFDVSSAFHTKDSYHIVAERFDTDSLRNKNLMLLTFSAKDLIDSTTIATDTSPEDGKAKVAVGQRVERFWRAMVEEDYETVYNLFDPFFRARNAREQYLRTTGRISYIEFDVQSIDIDGSRATVETKIRAGIKPFRASTGELIERPVAEMVVPEVWLNVDGEWFREFYSESQEVKYTRY